MKPYLVRLRAEVPYPKDFDYRIEASNAGRAMDFAYRKFRKEPQVRGKREKAIGCVVLPLAAIPEGTENEKVSAVSLDKLKTASL